MDVGFEKEMKLFYFCPKCGRGIERHKPDTASCLMCRVTAHPSGTALLLVTLALVGCIVPAVLTGTETLVFLGSLLCWPAAICLILAVMRLGKQLFLVTRRNSLQNESNKSMHRTSL